MTPHEEALKKYEAEKQRLEKRTAEFIAVEKRKKERAKIKSKRGFKKGRDNPRWKGGKRRVNGYIKILCPKHCRADQGGYVYESILVAEKKLGRPLLPSEVVYHLNGIRHDNRPENLVVILRQGRVGQGQ
jgi:hypothetical protein